MHEKHTKYILGRSIDVLIGTRRLRKGEFQRLKGIQADLVEVLEGMLKGSLMIPAGMDACVERVDMTAVYMLSTEMELR